MKSIQKRLKFNGFMIAAVLLLGSNLKAHAQEFNLKSDLLKITNASDSLNRANPAEKLYLQFDKPYYAIGDTIWFKAWLFNPSYFIASAGSNFIYVDIADQDNKVHRQLKYAVEAGMSWGNISLDDKTFAPGIYTIRAYTNWMMNFGNNGFFYRTFNVSGANDAGLLVNSRFSTSSADNKDTVTARLLFSGMDKIPFAVQPMQFQVVNNGKHLYHQKYITGVDGKLDVRFKLPGKVLNPAIIAKSEKKNRVAIIPVVLNRPDKMDVQFMPEGGYMVNSLPCRIGFKAVGEDGHGVNVDGIIMDHNQKQVTTFASVHNGMGCFELTPQNSEQYTAIITLPGGLRKVFPLPPIKTTGTLLQVKNAMESDSLELIIGASADITRSGESFFLVGRAREIVCYAAIVNFREGDFVRRKVAKTLFPTGIVHFTLMSTKYQPLNERLVFVDHHDNLNISFTPDKTSYQTRDSVTLKLNVSDKGGRPVKGNFSMSVTDNADVKIDTLADENMVTKLLLTSDLKGYVEMPGYYLSSKTNESWLALDNLLLTQGWTGYDWQKVLNPPGIVYQPEKEFTVTGHVTNALNKPVKGTHVLLFSKTPSILMDTVTDKDGKFIFNHFPPIDTPVFVIKGVNKRGKSFNVSVKVDDITPPDFVKPAGPMAIPWYINSDSTLLNYTKNNALIKQQQDFPVGGHVLKEVKITGRKIIKDSKNVNGTGNADWVLDEKDLEAAGKKSWLQLLQENIKDFRDGYFSTGTGSKAIKDFFIYLYVTDFNPDKLFTGEWYFIDGKPIKIIVDGVPVSQIIPTATFRDLTDYLQSHSAEDIKGFEVMSSEKFINVYLSRYDPIDPDSGITLLSKASKAGVFIGPADISFLEITTRGGQGPGLSNTPGMYLYKPLPLSLPARFYKPRYAVKDTAKRSPDLRSTIDWEPNITTGTNGIAKMFFYTADKPSTYTVTIEGADMSGHLGSKSFKLKVGGK